MCLPIALILRGFFQTVEQFSKTAHMLQQNTAYAMCKPDPNHKAIMGRGGKELFPKPEGVSPLIDTDAEQDQW